MLVNDTAEAARGRLEVCWESEGESLGQSEVPYSVPAFGQTTCQVELTTPQAPGKYLLKATAFWDDKPFSPTVSRRKVSIASTP